MTINSKNLRMSASGIQWFIKGRVHLKRVEFIQEMQCKSQKSTNVIYNIDVPPKYHVNISIDGEKAFKTV